MSLSANEATDPPMSEHSETENTSDLFTASELNDSKNKIPSNWAQKWTREEDQRLLQGIEQHGTSNWKMVAAVVGTRNAVKCMQRWEKGLKPGIVKGRWTDEEDRTLIYLVSQGHKNWGQVAHHMPGRTSKQCRERWNNYLDPTLIHTHFTAEEDINLVQYQKSLGNKWAAIAKLMPGRTENAVKLRFNAIAKDPAKHKELLQLQQSTIAAAEILNDFLPTTSSLPVTIQTPVESAEHQQSQPAAKRPRIEAPPLPSIPVQLAAAIPVHSHSEGHISSHSHSHSHGHGHGNQYDVFAHHADIINMNAADVEVDVDCEVLSSSDEEEDEEDR